MAKETFQDIIRSKSKSSIENIKDIDMSFRRGFDQLSDSSDSTGGHSRYTLWFIAVGSVVVLFFVLSYFFSGATITITPKQSIVSLEGISFNASKSASSGLAFEIMAVSGDESQTVVTTEDRVEASKAFGQIIIYNNFSSASQSLIATTRFETPDGKIYRIANNIIIPGQQKKDGKTIPGSIEVTVYADQTGDAYNIPLTDFTIPGLKGGAKYEKIYARSKTPFSGGSTGPVHVLPASSADQVRNELAVALQQKLITQAQAEIPPGYVLFDGGTFFNTTSSAKGDVMSNTATDVTVTASGTLDAIIFNEKDLVNAIVTKGIQDYDQLPVSIPFIDTLLFNLKNHDTISPKSVPNIVFDFTGVANVVWDVDEATIRESLAGQKKKKFDSLLSKYPSIEKASITISPFWKTTIPEDVTKIKIHMITQ